MIKNLSFSTFRGQTASYDFTMLNRVEGLNGAGKTTIQEAVSFVFAGTDSLGTRAPTHLITQGEDRTKVTATTSRAELSRSLTQKKSSTLSLEKGGVKQVLSQVELERLLCPTDLFLSVFVPGAFMRFPAKTKHAVFNAVLPQVARAGLLQELSGVSLSDPAYAALDLNRRPDLIAMDFASMRRKRQGFLDQNHGSIAALTNTVVTEPPLVPDALAELSQLEKGWKDGVQYNSDMKLYQERLRAISEAELENTRRAALVAQLKEELAAEHVLEVPAELDISEQKAQLEACLQTFPAEPLQLTVVETDHCPTCGQIVGTKHRDQVKENNQKVIEAYREDCSAIKDSNLKVQVQLQLLQEKKDKNTAAIKRRVEQNQQLEVRKARIESRIASTTAIAVPASLEEPSHPGFELVAFATLDNARRVVRQYEHDKSQYDLLIQQAATASEKIANLQQSVASHQQKIDELQALENAAKELPAKEFEMRESYLAIPGYKFVVEDDIGLVDSRGIPYELLSAAERTKADVMISLKLNQLMPHKVGMIFIDNAEHLDPTTQTNIMGECQKQEMQLFFAYVGTAPQVLVTSF